MTRIFGVFDSEDRPAPGADYTVWADASLYYRDELCRSLGIRTGEECDDAYLILSAYLKWGEACVDRLEGDFAFAILNPMTNVLFCARDHFGMRPFFYHHSGSRFVFASHARDIFAVPDVPYAINEGRVADFIVQELEWIDYTSTFYEDIYRLPPGHCMTVSRDRRTVREYWEPLPGADPGPMSDDEWREGFMDIFGRAVDERLRSPAGCVGAMLSGGMDSGSIAAVANGILNARGEQSLRTYSAAQPQAIDCVESRRIYASSDYLGVCGTTVFPDDIGDLDTEFLASIEEPFDASFLFMWAIYRAAAADGMSVLLDGGAGDILLNEGSYLIRLARQGNVLKAYQEIVAEQSFWENGDIAPEIAHFTASVLAPNFLKSAVRPYRQRRDASRFVAASLISRSFADRVDIEERCARMYRMFPGDWTNYVHERLRKVRPNVSAGRERYARLAASAGVEARDPFLDSRVVNFCTHLPGHLLIRDGWPKAILRDVMAGKLPGEVRRGRGKPHVGWVFSEKFLEREKNSGRLTLADLQDTLEGYVDAGKLDRAWQTLAAGKDFEPVHMAHVLSLWLKNSESRPVVKYQ